jgi:21S rRNA (uridine2791-2'-O)-methyltransferase
VAIAKTRPDGRVLGIDILPCPAPPGSSAMQGNFLSRDTQERIKKYLAHPAHGRAATEGGAMIGEEIGYIDMAERDGITEQEQGEGGTEKGLADVVLSDMSEPWPQTEGFWKNHLTETYFRMMNVSGIRVKDHVDSMVLVLWRRCY